MCLYTSRSPHLDGDHEPRADPQAGRLQSISDILPLIKNRFKIIRINQIASLLDSRFSGKRKQPFSDLPPQPTQLRRLPIVLTPATDSPPLSLAASNPNASDGAQRGAARSGSRRSSPPLRLATSLWNPWIG